MLRKINDLIEALLRVTGGLLFIAFITTILFQVIARNFIAMPFVWTDEIAMFCFIWSVFIGSAVGYRKGLHYLVEIFPENYVKINNLLKILALFLGFPLIYVLTTSGWDYAQLGWGRYSFSLGIPMFYQSIIVPICGIVMMLFSCELLVTNTRELFTNTHTVNKA